MPHPTRYLQAVAETEGHEDDADTDMDRKKRLRADKAEALAYDPEQRALRDALKSRLNSDAAGDDGAEAGGSGEEDDMGGLTVRQRAAPDNATVCPTPHHCRTQTPALCPFTPVTTSKQQHTPA